MKARLLLGDCRDSMRAMDAESIDAIVSDPPYGLSFMGKGWDHGVPGEDFWIEALRVAKPGAHLLAFGGTRTFHRLVVAIEDAGWEIRDCLMWVYASGFPKSLDVSKAIDKAAGALLHESVRFTVAGRTDKGLPNPVVKGYVQPAPATEAARRWKGWGTALKPAYEPIIMARKPLTGTVAANVLRHRTGALNIDGCRVAASAGDQPLKWEHGRGMGFYGAKDGGPCAAKTNNGRWPANLILTHAPECGDECAPGCPCAALDAQSGKLTSRIGGVTSNPKGHRGAAYGAESRVEGTPRGGYDDTGGASRFFYCAKASTADRDKGCAGLDAHKQDETRNEGDPGGNNSRNRGAGERSNLHPTVKPTDLMRYLCRLVTPLGGTVLDPFMGSGSTGKAATLEGFSFVGCELQPEYMAIAEARIKHAEGEVEPLFWVRS